MCLRSAVGESPRQTGGRGGGARMRGRQRRDPAANRGRELHDDTGRIPHALPARRLRMRPRQHGIHGQHRASRNPPSATVGGHHQPSCPISAYNNRRRPGHIRRSTGSLNHRTDPRQIRVEHRRDGRPITDNWRRNNRHHPGSVQSSISSRWLDWTHRTNHPCAIDTTASGRRRRPAASVTDRGRRRRCWCHTRRSRRRAGGGRARASRSPCCHGRRARRRRNGGGRRRCDRTGRRHRRHRRNRRCRRAGHGGNRRRHSGRRHGRRNWSGRHRLRGRRKGSHRNRRTGRRCRSRCRGWGRTRRGWNRS